MRNDDADKAVLALCERIGGLEEYRRYTSEALGYVKKMLDEGDRVLADKIIDCLNEREVYAIEQIQGMSGN